MTLSRSNPRAKVRWLFLVGVTVALMLAVAAVTLAVHDEDFQLDGDVLSSTNTNGGAQPVDWDAIFNADGTTKTSLPPGFSDAALTKDFQNSGTTFITADTTTFATGSKDTLPISGWQCNFDNNVNSKIDVMNAYSTSYQLGTGDEFIYFALERNTNTGDANVGFWFLQDEVGCTSTGGAVTFTGEHFDGDVLIVSEFSNGGDVSTINVYRWVRNNGSPDCLLDPIGAACVLNPAGVPGFLLEDAIGAGVDCRDPNLPPGDPACAASNTTANGDNGTIDIPWLTAAFKEGVGHKLRTSEFFEGGVNLTDLDLGGKCFNTFIGDTRSSTSLTATLFDFALGVTGSCTSTTVTTPTPGGGTGASASIGAGAAVNVSDQATITVDGVDTWSGTVTFRLCGPTALTNPVTYVACGSGQGTLISTENVNQGLTVVTSDTAVVTSVGSYCWRADFSGDAVAGVPPSSDARAPEECFSITPLQPDLQTQAVDEDGVAITAAVPFGSTIYDQATLTGTANKPGSPVINPPTLGGEATGTITFKLFGPGTDATACATLAAGFPAAGITVNVTGGDSPPTYGGPPTVGFEPQSPGIYHWKATYSGDPPNTLGDTDNDTCQDANERVEVQRLQPNMNTAQNFVPNDSATITVASGAGDLAGSVVFKLYVNDSNCSDPADYETAPIDITTGTGTALSRTVVSANTTAYSTTGTTFHWVVTYTSTNPAHLGVSSPCGNEHSSITISNGATQPPPAP